MQYISRALCLALACFVATTTCYADDDENKPSDTWFKKQSNTESDKKPVTRNKKTGNSRQLKASDQKSWSRSSEDKKPDERFSEDQNFEDRDSEDRKFEYKQPKYKKAKKEGSDE